MVEPLQCTSTISKKLEEFPPTLHHQAATADHLIPTENTLLLAILAFVFYKFYHVVNTKNSYSCFRCKLTIQRVPVRRSIMHMRNKRMNMVTGLVFSFSFVQSMNSTCNIFTLLIAGSITPASKLLRTVPFTRSSPILQGKSDKPVQQIFWDFNEMLDQQKLDTETKSLFISIDADPDLPHLLILKFFIGTYKLYPHITQYKTY